MRHPVASVALLLMLAPAAARAQESPARGSGSACITCHANLPDHLGAPVAAWNAGDVHKDAGLGCVGCHGGDPSPALAEDLRSMAPETGFMPAPDRLQLAATCARCHSDAAYMKQFNPQARVDQFAEYLTSAHGRANQAGDPVPATCSDCHGVHGIRSVKSPASPAYASNVPATCATCHSDAAVMDPYGLPIDVHESYMDSTHADALLIRGDLAAPACNDCHGNHGAAPPGVTSVANVCGQCHGREATLFRGSFKKELFDSMEMSECIVCHGQHRILHPTPELFHGKSAPSRVFAMMRPLGRASSPHVKPATVREPVDETNSANCALVTAKRWMPNASTRTRCADASSGWWRPEPIAYSPTSRNTISRRSFLVRPAMRQALGTPLCSLASTFSTLNAAGSCRRGNSTSDWIMSATYAWAGTRIQTRSSIQSQ